uniref:Uncharacterized protein n=1 Tax=Moniliophthora roreri TaxID=221103 RepID=A0A0W0GF98_MONRR
MSPNHAAELVTAIAEDGHGVAVVIGAIVTFVLAFALYRLLRLIYPCLTLFELESAESSLDVVFDNAASLEEKGLGNSLQESSEFLFHLEDLPRIPSRIVIGDHRMEQRCRETSTGYPAIVEDDNQHRYDIELNRRGNAVNRPSIAPPILPTASSSSTSHARAGADIITLILAVALCRFVRLLYPCLTVSELDKAEKTVQSTFSDAINNGCLYGHKLEIITQSKLRLRKRAAERREKFQLNNSIWKNFIGIDIELVPDIVQWYTAAERLQRDILVCLLTGSPA